MGTLKTVGKHVLITLAIVALAAWLSRSTSFGKKIFATS